jgi:hypothetical protein
MTFCVLDVVSRDVPIMLSLAVIDRHFHRYYVGAQPLLTVISTGIVQVLNVASRDGTDTIVTLAFDLLQKLVVEDFTQVHHRGKEPCIPCKRA